MHAIKDAYDLRDYEEANQKLLTKWRTGDAWHRMKEQVINNLDAWKLDFNAKVPDKDPLLVENSLKELKERLSDGIPGWEHILDDKHLLKFLRYKDLNVPATFKMFDLIHKRRMAEPTRYFPEGKGPLHYKHVYELRCAEVLHHRNPRDGTAVVIIRVGDWKPETGVDYFTSQNAGIFLVEYVLDDERVQRDGVTLIIDFKGFRFSWVMQFFPPSYLPTIITTLQDTAPIRFIGIHILNQPVMYKILYGMAYPFISKENQQKIHFHGTNIVALQKYVDRSILPKDLLGPQEPDYMWLPEMVYKNHDFFVARSYLPKGKKTDGKEKSILH